MKSRKRLRITPGGTDLALRAMEHVEQADAAFSRPLTNSDTGTERIVALIRQLVETE
jgi:hypothetical protein